MWSRVGIAKAALLAAVGTAATGPARASRTGVELERAFDFDVVRGKTRLRQTRLLAYCV